MRAQDVDWRSGRCFSYVFSAGDEVRDVASAATTMYLSENALNTAAFPSLGRIQAEVVDAVAGFAHGGSEAAGFMTSGGTESILCGGQGGTRAGRARARHHRARDGAARQRARRVPQGRALLRGHVRQGARAVTTSAPTSTRWPRASTTNTVLVVGSAPQYPQGVDRPDPGAGRARRRRAAPTSTPTRAWAASCCPFMELLGHDVAPWDFRVDGRHLDLGRPAQARVHAQGRVGRAAPVEGAAPPPDVRCSTTGSAGSTGRRAWPGPRPALPMATAWAVMQPPGRSRATSDSPGATIDAARRMVAGVARHRRRCACSASPRRTWWPSPRPRRR